MEAKQPPHKGLTMSDFWYPHVTVATIVEKENLFLLVEEEIDGARVYNQPAGHLEKEESLIDAAVRETLEETGWQVAIESVCGFYLYTSSKNQTTYLRCCFIAQPLKDTGATLDDGIIAARWMSYQQILEKGAALRSSMVIQCMDDYLSGQQFPLTSIHHSPKA